MPWGAAASAPQGVGGAGTPEVAVSQTSTVKAEAAPVSTSTGARAGSTADAIWDPAKTSLIATSSIRRVASAGVSAASSAPENASRISERYAAAGTERIRIGIPGVATSAHPQRFEYLF